MVQSTGTTGTVKRYAWYSNRVRLARYKGTTGTVQGYDWYGTTGRLVRCKGTTGTVQGFYNESKNAPDSYLPTFSQPPHTVSTHQIALQESCFFLRCSHASMAPFHSCPTVQPNLPLKPFCPAPKSTPTRSNDATGLYFPSPRQFQPARSPFLSCFLVQFLGIYSALPVVPLIMPHLPSTPFLPSPTVSRLTRSHFYSAILSSQGDRTNNETGSCG